MKTCNIKKACFRFLNFLTSSPFFRSPVALILLLLHGIGCFITLLVGFRSSAFVAFFIYSSRNLPVETEAISTRTPIPQYDLNFTVTNVVEVFNGSRTPIPQYDLNFTVTNAVEVFNGSRTPIPQYDLNFTITNAVEVFNGSRTSATNAHNDTNSNSSRVRVGRHEILVRPWPHPYPSLVMKSYQTVERVQQEQRRLSYSRVQEWKTVIAITPTYKRTFQALHLNGLMHTLMLVPGKIIWIVVEAGGVSNETTFLLAQSRLPVYHLPFSERMPVTREDRRLMEIRMRIQGLRFVREKKLDGIVMFADESNTHSLDLFDEIQAVKWMGALSVGFLRHSKRLGVQESKGTKSGLLDDEDSEANPTLPIQGPACDSLDHLVGWHTFNTQSCMKKNGLLIDDGKPVLQRRLEWAGFALNARLVWEDSSVPDWVHDWEQWIADVKSADSPLSVLKDESYVEPLGRCGRTVLVWWFRAEARADSKFPSRWIINPPLEVVVPAKNTSWLNPLVEWASSQSIDVGNRKKHGGKSIKFNKSKQNFRQSYKRKHDARQRQAQHVSLNL